MKKGQVSVAIAGAVLGFLVGFMVAHQIYVGRGEAFQHPPIPPGMTGAGPAPGVRQDAGGGVPGRTVGADGAAAAMESVTQEIAALPRGQIGAGMLIRQLAGIEGDNPAGVE